MSAESRARVRGAIPGPDGATPGKSLSEAQVDGESPFSPVRARAGIALLSTAFVFLRHGESVGNRDALIAGSLDVSLTGRGREQAAAAADDLAALPIDRIFTSQLQRARETAAIVAAPRALPVVTFTELGERHWGALEGRPRVERLHGVLPAGAESFEAFASRVCEGLARIPATGLPVVCAHSGLWRVITALLELEPSEAPIGNAQPVVVRPCAAGWSVEPVARRATAA